MPEDEFKRVLGISTGEFLSKLVAEVAGSDTTEGQRVRMILAGHGAKPKPKRRRPKQGDLFRS